MKECKLNTSAGTVATVASTGPYLPGPTFAPGTRLSDTRRQPCLFSPVCCVLLLVLFELFV